MKLFSLEKANALIPVLRPLLDDLWTQRRELAIRLLENDPALRAAGGRGPQATAQRRRDQRRVAEMKAEIVGSISRIEGYGCLVKDVDLGLLDFPMLRDGRPVFLCWRRDEAAVAHWHRPDESYVDRKPL